jgi:hypothetical protein
MKQFIFPVFFALIFSSCTKDKQQAIMIRVNNQSQLTLDDMRIYSKTKEYAEISRNYGDVKFNTASVYKSHEIVPDYPLISFFVEGYGQVQIRNIRCAVGLGFLEPGDYSLLIEGNSPNSFHFRFVKD